MSTGSHEAHVMRRTALSGVWTPDKAVWRMTCATREGSWRLAAAAMLVIGWGGNQFTPLLRVYRQVGGYSQFDVDVFLGAYVFGLIPGLLVAAAVSESRGRRPVLLAGLWSSTAGSLVLSFGVHAGYLGICLGRLLCGVAVGIAMSVGTAWVAELSAGDGGARSSAGVRRGAIWLTAGLALGPASAGLLASYATPALTWPYLTHALLCAPVIALVSRAPWAETRGGGSAVALRHRLRVPALRNRRFRRVVAPMAPWVFGSAAVAYVIVPQQVQGSLGSRALLFATGLTVLTLGTGVVVQPLARRLDDASTARAIVVSMGLMTVGVALAVATAMTGSAVLAVPVAMSLGAAYGIAVVSGLLEVARIARPDELAGLTGAYYALCYLGFLMPAVLAGLGHRFSYPQMLAVLTVGALACTVCCASGWAKHLPVRSAAI
jgi:predicted MFS family arabinose efflux permease